MATKTISIKDKVYYKLAASKRNDESFSGTIDRLLSRNKRLSDFFGTLEMTDKELGKAKSDLSKFWGKWSRGLT